MNIRKQFKEDIQGIIAQNSHLTKIQLAELINQSFNSDNVYLRLWAEEKDKALKGWTSSVSAQATLNF